MPPTHIAAVTGANKGLGLAIVRQLALRYASSPLGTASASPGSFLIYLTSRDQNRGEAAVAALQGDAALKQARALSSHGGATEIRWAGLNLDDSASISSFAEQLRREHGARGIDIVVNNAGVAFDGFDAEVVRATLLTNYWQTMRASRAWLPLLKDSETSRLVNMASTVGRLQFYSEDLQKRFRQAREKADGGVEEADALLSEFQDLVEKGTQEENGWPSKAYAVSKAGLIAATGALAKEEKARGFKGLINCCCPGWVVTDLTKGRGFKKPDQGAEIAVKLALDDLGGVTGEFWSDDKIKEW